MAPVLHSGKLLICALISGGLMLVAATGQGAAPSVKPSAQPKASAPAAARPGSKTAKAEKFGLSNPNAPISVAADRLDADQNSHTLIYTGHAVVQQGDVYLHTDRLKVLAPDGKTPDKIYADGHVILTASSGTAIGDKGVYDVTPRIITLTGHVVLTRGENVMRGEKLTINLISGVAHLNAAEGQTQKPGRIQGMFTPKNLSGDTSGTNTGKKTTKDR